MNTLALFCILMKNVIYGSTIFFTGKLTESTDVLDVLALRFLMCFIVMWLLKKTGILKIKISVKDFFVKNERSAFIKNLVLAAIFEPILYMFFETVGIANTTGITAGTILALAPVASCIFEIVMLKEKGNLPKYLLIAIGIAGVLYITFNTSTNDGQNTVFGIICVFVAVISGVLFSVFSRKSSKHFEPIEISYIAAMLGTVVFNAVNVARHIWVGDLQNYFVPYCNVQNLIGFAFLAVGSSILATVMGNYALKKMTISTAAAFGGLSTLVTLLISVIFEHEKVYMFHYIGMILIFTRMIGIVILEKKEERKINLKSKKSSLIF